ncbi:MAG: membrane protein insertion efficiency factor YidD [Candidatus Parcubacteria bacterium]|nr:membrane protein insertion efficiency factor YidD [Burkholderiales bacterium]
MMVAPKRLLGALVRSYRYFLSPLLPPACRFLPSCSAYAEQAIHDHGVLRGGWLTARRLCRCGPWHSGGLDPVPERSDSEGAVAGFGERK